MKWPLALLGILVGVAIIASVQLQAVAAGPFYPSLQSHEISSLTKKYGKKVFESYLENQTPGVARMFWSYGPDRADITILALEPHPEPGEYGRVQLASEPQGSKSDHKAKRGK
jgi:hypothetical protein